MEDETARRGQGAAHERQLLLAAPDLLLLDGVPGDQLAHVVAGPGLGELELGGQEERPGLVVLGAVDDVHAEVERRDVDEPRLRAVGHRLPVLPAEEVRAHVPGPDVLPRPLLRDLDRPAGGAVDPLGPVDEHERVGRDELAGLPVQHVEEAVPVGLQRERRLLALDRRVHQHELVDAVVVPDVVRRRLVVPDDLAGVGVEGERAGGVEIGVLAVLAAVRPADPAPPGRGVAGAVVDEVELRVVGADEPGGAPARLPRLALPRLVARLAGARDRVGPPDLAAGLLVVRGDRAAHAVLAPGEARHHEVLRDRGRRGDRVALLVVHDLRLPQLLARARVEGDQHGVEARHEELAVRVGDAPVVEAAAGGLLDVGRDLGRVLPADGARLGVHGVDVARPRRGRHVEGVADDDGRRFLRFERAELEDPRDLEPVHGARVDPAERAVAGVGAVPAVRRPAGRLGRGGAGEPRCREKRHDDDEAECSHDGVSL